MARKKKAKLVELEAITETAEVTPEGWMSAEDLPPLPTEPDDAFINPVTDKEPPRYVYRRPGSEDTVTDKERPRYVYRHPACYGPAFFIDHMPHPRELLKRTNVRLEDGTVPGPSTPMLCGHCGLSVGPLQTRHVREL